MSKEIIIGATPEQVNENTLGRLYTVSQNATGGMDCNMYCFIADVKQKDKKIADLEAKLAESEEFTQGYRKECAKIQSENVQLKQKLAEYEKFMKDNEWDSIEEMQETLIIEKGCYRFIKSTKQGNLKLENKLEEKDEQIKMLQEHKEIADNTIEMYATKCKDSGQDKISFAIEKLERVKEKLNDYDIQEILSSSSDPYGEFDENCVTTDTINTIIDNQIKQLKEMK